MRCSLTLSSITALRRGQTLPSGRYHARNEKSQDLQRVPRILIAGNLTFSRFSIITATRFNGNYTTYGATLLRKAEALSRILQLPLENDYSQWD